MFEALKFAINPFAGDTKANPLGKPWKSWRLIICWVVASPHLTKTPLIDFNFSRLQLSLWVSSEQQSQLQSDALQVYRWVAQQVRTDRGGVVSDQGAERSNLWEIQWPSLRRNKMEPFFLPFSINQSNPLCLLVRYKKCVLCLNL